MDRQTVRYKKTDWQVDKPTDRHVVRHTERHIEKYRYRQIYIDRNMLTIIYFKERKQKEREPYIFIYKSDR